nr:DoxX-like family protein [Nocardiopsis sp. FR4]
MRGPARTCRPPGDHRRPTAAGRHLGPPVLVAIGLAEAAIGVWVLSGRWPYAAAAVQTAPIGVFNLGGLLVSPAALDEPGRMLTANLAIVALAWAVAGRHAAGHPAGARR